MEKNKSLQGLINTGLIVIIRAESSKELKEAAIALREGGARFIEVTMTTPNALKVIGEISKSLSDVIIGVGSVLDPETAKAAILSGAEFVVCPTLNRDVIRLCNRYSKIVIPGAFTPTEILSAWETGADLVKVFPSSGGPSYIKAIKAPLPQISLVPVGGVNIENVADFIKAGASAVGVGGNLVKKEFLERRDFTTLTQLCRKFVGAIRDAKDK